MKDEFLSKIRKLNWVLSESRTGSLSYGQLSSILREIMVANVYIVDNQGKVLGMAYSDAMDTSTVEDELGFERVPEEDNQKFLTIEKTRVNLREKELTPILGEAYKWKDKYHIIVPSICGGKRLGTLILARYGMKFSDVDIALCEYGATLVGLEIQRKLQDRAKKEKELKLSFDLAVDTLSYSEKDAFEKIMKVMGHHEEMVMVVSKFAREYDITNSVMVSALKKLESAGVLETKSLGVKGTYVKVLNPFLRGAFSKNME